MPERGRKRALIVVDMQRDYDTAANIELYGEVRSPYANEISPLVSEINAVRARGEFDRVVFTFDWLTALELEGRTPFCEEGSAGAELLDGLVVDRHEDIFFRKNSDDSFCEEGGRPEAATGCSRLQEVLGCLGLHAADTDLWFVGQRFERCLMKTVVHAAELGYRAAVVDSATYTKCSDPDEEWHLQGAEGAPGDAACAAAWQVYLARKSAGRLLAERYLREAGAQICAECPEEFGAVLAA